MEGTLSARERVRAYDHAYLGRCRPRRRRARRTRARGRGGLVLFRVFLELATQRGNVDQRSHNVRGSNHTHLLDLLGIEFPLTRELAELAHVLCEELGDAFAGNGFAILALEGVSEGGDDVRWVLRSWRCWGFRRGRGHRVPVVFCRRCQIGQRE